MKRKRGSDLIFLLTVAVITSVLWVGFEAYRTLNRVPAPSGVEELLTQLTVSLRLDVLEKLGEKTQ